MHTATAPASPVPRSDHGSPSLAKLLAPISADMALVDDVIRNRLGTEVELIGTVAQHIIAAGGKRLRPALLLMIARALGYEGETHALLAAVIEFIHTATLLHDDVVDESDLRRGRATANAAFGNAASVLVGDFLYSRAFQLMIEAGHPRVLPILADATNRIAEGEVLQLLNIGDPSVDEARYFRVVERKTATLFQAAARLGAVLAGAGGAVEEACGRYGAALGTAFQIIDDVLDFAGEPEDIGKRLGDDLREGKATLPLIHALREGDAGQKEILEAAIRGGDGNFAEVAAIIRSLGSLRYAHECAERELAAAEAAVRLLPPSSYRDSLLNLVVFAAQRDR